MGSDSVYITAKSASTMAGLKLMANWGIPPRQEEFGPSLMKELWKSCNSIRTLPTPRRDLQLSPNSDTNAKGALREAIALVIVNSLTYLLDGIESVPSKILGACRFGLQTKDIAFTDAKYRDLPSPFLYIAIHIKLAPIFSSSGR